MRHYELIFVVHPELDETAVGETLDRVKNWITESGNEVTKVDQWGKRRLAYPIRKQKEGYYFLFNISISIQQQRKKQNPAGSPIFRIFACRGPCRN